MSVSAIVLNIGILIFTSNKSIEHVFTLFKMDYNDYNVLTLLLVCEHIIIILMVIISAVIEDKPTWI